MLSLSCSGGTTPGQARVFRRTFGTGYHIVTVTEKDRHCAWCGGAIPIASTTGRPRRYCRRSHRQRAFEARRAGATRGLAPGEAIIAAAALEALRDARYVLRTALEDAASDLAGGAGPDDLKEAYEAVAAAAAAVTEISLEPEAVGRE